MGLSVEIPITDINYSAGGFPSQGITLNSISFDSNNTQTYGPLNYYQVRTNSDTPAPIDLEDCEFLLWFEIDVNYSDSTNSNGNNKIIVRNSIQNIYTVVEKI